MAFKKTLFLLGLVSLFLTSTARADYYYDCCSPEYCAPCSNWVVYGDWLYWRARRCQLDFALTGEPSGAADSAVGRVYSIEPTYDNGFRLGIQKYCGDLFFDAYYTYFRNSESKNLSSQLLKPPQQQYRVSNHDVNFR